MAAPMKNDGKATSRPTTKTSSANTVDFANSIGNRFGTASRLARIMPVEYSLAMTMTPRTQIVSWLNWKPAPRMKLTVSSTTDCRSDASVSVHWAAVSPVISVVKPIVRTNSNTNAQIVDRTERIFVHSDVMSRLNATGEGGGPAAPTRGAVAVVTTTPFRAAQSPGRPRRAPDRAPRTPRSRV